MSSSQPRVGRSVSATARVGTTPCAVSGGRQQLQVRWVEGCAALPAAGSSRARQGKPDPWRQRFLTGAADRTTCRPRRVAISDGSALPGPGARRGRQPHSRSAGRVTSAAGGPHRDQHRRIRPVTVGGPHRPRPSPGRGRMGLPAGPEGRCDQQELARLTGPASAAGFVRGSWRSSSQSPKGSGPELPLAAPDQCSSMADQRPDKARGPPGRPAGRHTRRLAALRSIVLIACAVSPTSLRRRDVE